MALTIEQQRALALARARVRLSEAAPPDRTFLGAVAEAPSHLADSASKFYGGMVQGLGQLAAHPVQTLSGAAQGAWDVGKGVAQQYRDLSPQEFQGSAPRMDTAPAVRAETAVYDRYGAMPGPQRQKPGFNKQNLYNTIATDPVGTAADLSTLLAAPEAMGLRGASRAGQVGELLAKGSQVLNPVMAPVNAARGLVKAGGALEPIASNVMAGVTGTSATALREAGKAGYEGGAKGEAFQANLRGEANPLDVVEQARAAVGKLYAERSQAYRDQMLPVSKDPTVLSFTGIEKAVDDVRDRGSYKGVSINKEASDAWNKINKEVEDWKKLNPADYHTAEGLDALKKSIGDIQQSLPYGSPARSAADAVYNAIKAEIIKQAPDYGKAMAGYEQTSQHLKDLERELSTGKKAAAGTAARKLQAALRNNANTGWGSRTDMARELEAAGADTLFPALAGQALSPAFPRGLSGVAVGGAEGMAALNSGFNPAHMAGALAAGVASSPRLVGEATYYGGKAVRLADLAKDELKARGVTSNRVNKAALIGQQLARPKTKEKQ